MTGRSAEELCGLPVRLHGLALGRAIDVVLDLGSGRAVGVDVLCGDDTHRFLPLAAARLEEGAIVIGSALMLLDEAERRFYHKRGTSLTTLRGAPVEHDDALLGGLVDVLLADDLSIAGLVVDGPGRALVPLEAATRVGEPQRRIPAA